MASNFETFPSTENFDVAPHATSFPGELNAETLREVDRNHIASIRARTAAEHQKLNAHIAANETKLAGHNARLSRVQTKLESTDAFIRIRKEQDVVPWTALDRIKVTIYLALSALLLVMTIVTTSNILLKSGYFDSKFVAFVFSGLPLIVPAALETLSSVFQSDLARRRYQLGLALAGPACAMGWALCYVATFGSAVSMNTGAIIDQISSGETDSGNIVGQTMLVLGLVAESLIAAAIWVAIERCCHEHSGGKIAANPDRLLLQDELNLALSEHAETIKTIGELRGRQAELLACEQVYTNAAATITSILSTVVLSPESPRNLERKPQQLNHATQRQYQQAL